ncbi:hypothetical protein PYK22_01387 [Pyrinomonas methylaliphatogenes]|uniref:Uncharacterized protein n=1 Tax=Pyrinomonas methylaliphatogenes TaxID=454194 RepID=A0A0B6WVT2_9BACT|nr:hypothetical protein PYK22_01387 [Pyrinomonas methylaliphatogenes]
MHLRTPRYRLLGACYRRVMNYPKAGYGAVQLALSVASSLGRPSNKLLRMIGS